MQAALQLNDTPSTRSPAPSQVSEMVRHARTIFLKGHIDESIQLLKDALTLDPGFVPASQLLCRALIVNRQFDEAEARLTALCEKFDDVRHIALLVRVLLSKEDWPRAETEAERALARFPHNQLLRELYDCARFKTHFDNEFIETEEFPTEIIIKADQLVEEAGPDTTLTDDQPTVDQPTVEEPSASASEDRTLETHTTTDETVTPQIAPLTKPKRHHASVVEKISVKPKQGVTRKLRIKQLGGFATWPEPEPARDLHDLPKIVYPEPAPSTYWRLTATPKRRKVTSWFLGLGIGAVILIICVSAYLGMRQRQVDEARWALTEARRLGQRTQFRAITKALEHVRHAINLQGRRPEHLAFAAVLHGKLAIFYGESNLSSTVALIEESRRMGGSKQLETARDLTVAQALVHLGSKSLTQSMSEVQRARTLDPANLDLQLLYVYLLGQLGQYDEALRTLRPLISDDSQILWLKAQIDWKKQDKAEAYESLRRARASGLHDDQARLIQAMFSLDDPESNEPLDATTLTELARSKHLSTFEKAWARLLLAESLLKQEKKHEAETALTQALEQSPTIDGTFYERTIKVARALDDKRHLDRAVRQASFLLPNQVF